VDEVKTLSSTSVFTRTELYFFNPSPILIFKFSGPLDYPLKELEFTVI